MKNSAIRYLVLVLSIGALFYFRAYFDREKDIIELVPVDQDRVLVLYRDWCPEWHLQSREIRNFIELVSLSKGTVWRRSVQHLPRNFPISSEIANRYQQFAHTVTQDCYAYFHEKKELLCLRLSDGEVLWKGQGPAGETYDFLFSDDKYFYLVENKQRDKPIAKASITVLEPKSGKLIWRKEYPGLELFSLFADGGETLVFIGREKETFTNVVVYKKSGQHKSLGDNLRRCAIWQNQLVYGQPAVKTEVLMREYYLYSFQSEENKLLGKSNVLNKKNPSLTNHTIIGAYDDALFMLALDEEPHLAAFSLPKFELLWQQNFPQFDIGFSLHAHRQGRLAHKSQTVLWPIKAPYLPMLFEKGNQLSLSIVNLKNGHVVFSSKAIFQRSLSDEAVYSQGKYLMALHLANSKDRALLVFDCEKGKFTKALQLRYKDSGGSFLLYPAIRSRQRPKYKIENKTLKFGQLYFTKDGKLHIFDIANNKLILGADKNLICIDILTKFEAAWR